MASMVLWGSLVREAQGDQWVMQAQRAFQVSQVDQDLKDQRELLEHLDHRELLVLEGQGVILVQMVQLVKWVLRDYQGLRDLKDCVANQETLVYLALMDHKEKREKLVPQALKDHQDHKEMWVLRVLLGVKEEKDREGHLEREDLMVPKDLQDYLEIGALLAPQVNLE